MDSAKDGGMQRSGVNEPPFGRRDLTDTDRTGQDAFSGCILIVENDDSTSTQANLSEERHLEADITAKSRGQI